MLDSLNPLKKRSMDAITHPETKAHIRLLGGASAHAASPAPSGFLGLTPESVKQMAMSAISSVETVAQIGLLKLTGGIAIYAAHIRQVDREGRKNEPTRKIQKGHMNNGRELSRGPYE